MKSNTKNRIVTRNFVRTLNNDDLQKVHGGLNGPYITKDEDRADGAA